MEATRDTENLQIPDSIRETASADGAVLLDIEQGICFSLNPVGLKIWECLKKHDSIEQIVQALTGEFPVPRAQLRADTLEFIAVLEAKGLIRPPGQKSNRQSWIQRVIPVAWRKERAQI
jgi:hypothetical protein